MFVATKPTKIRSSIGADTNLIRVAPTELCPIYRRRIYKHFAPTGAEDKFANHLGEPLQT